MPTITIVFRGLLVLNKDQIGRFPSMEVGILEEKHDHVPRIMTFRNGVREETRLLDTDGDPEVWQLVVDDPATNGITLRQPSTSFNRLDPNSALPDDFQWIINLENGEFPYGDIDRQFTLDRKDLKRVVQITSGEFYTRLKSTPLRRSENGGVPVDFGAIGGVMGLDIQVNSGGARLVRPDGAVIFPFESGPNVMYEFANSPKDTETRPVDHFHHYYHIFKNQPPKKFGFARRPLGGAAAPGPNPALCGKIYLGEFDGSLTSGSGESGTSESGTSESETSESGTITDTSEGYSHGESSAKKS